jgi:hypothetical protein
MLRSLAPFLNYDKKIALSIVDVNYGDNFIKNVKPPNYFYTLIFDRESIDGLEFLYKNFYINLHGFLHTKYFTPSIFKCNKKKFLEWLLKKDDEEARGSIKNTLRRMKKGHVSYDIDEEFKKILKKYGFEFGSS